MLGLILYEAVDIVYHVGKMGVNGVVTTYNWYYDIKPETPETTKIKDLEDKLHKLTEKYEALEKKLK
jgi:ABC-type Fe3+-hydroxamate transport system substrate-binding protein